MKKIIILVIALLSTGIVFSAISNKNETAIKTVEVKVQKGDFTVKTTRNVDIDVVSTAD
jgi:archaellum component FlaF (FlaF/FlaG flagellin family)